MKYMIQLDITEESKLGNQIDNKKRRSNCRKGSEESRDNDAFQAKQNISHRIC